MTVKLFVLQNISLPWNVSNLRQANEQQLLDLRIHHNVNKKCKAEVSFRKSIDLEQHKFICLTYNQNIIFIGKITNISIHKHECTLVAISESFEDYIQEVFNQNPIPQVLNPNYKTVNDILLFDSKMNVYNLYQEINKRHKHISDINIYSKSVESSNKSTSKITLNLLWKSQKYTLINLLQNVNIALVYNKLLKDKQRPIKKYQNFEHYIVSDANEQALNFKKYVKILNKEIWNLNVHIPNLPNLKLYLDLNKHIQTHPSWAPNHNYKIGDISFHDGKLCKCIN
ncbi:MAG: hypothetical protein KC414_06080, partial [Romboutsia sp.]|nr:hypothetical protein [Romboutsia sp.]